MYQKICEQYRLKNIKRVGKSNDWSDIHWDDFENGELLKLIIEDEDVRMFQLFLENGFNVNQTYRICYSETKKIEDKNYPFFSYLISEEKYRLLTIALDFGLDVNQIYGYRQENILIHLAMTSQNKRKKAFIEFFKKCIENGADIHKKDVYGMDALLFSVSREHEELIKILIEYGADIKTISSNYSNVLHIANSANVKLIKLLIENGAHKVLNDIKKGTQTTAGLMTPGYTPIMCAINYNDENVLYYLSLGADVNHMTEDGISFWSLLYQKIKYDPNDKFIEQVKNYLGENRVEENMKKEKNKERLHNLFK